MIFGITACNNTQPAEDTIASNAVTSAVEEEKVYFSSDAKPVDGKEYEHDGFVYIIYDDDSIEITKYIGNDEEIDISTEINGYKVSRIGANAFENCTFIKEIYIWADVIAIGEGAFKGCSGIKEISIPSSVTVIADSICEDCTNIVDVYIWGDVVSIGKYAFANCTSLKEISIPSSCKTVGESAFYGCKKLANVYVWGDDVEYEINAFANCPNLEDMPEGAVNEYVRTDDDSEEKFNEEIVTTDNKVESEPGVVENIYTASDIPNELMNDEFKNVVDLFSKGFSESGLDISDATTYDDGETYIFYLDNLEFLGEECEDGSNVSPRVIYGQDAISNDGTPELMFLAFSYPRESNGYEETVEMVEDIAEALNIFGGSLIDNDYSSSSKWATGEYATFTFPNLNLKLTVSNMQSSVEIEIVRID